MQFRFLFVDDRGEEVYVSSPEELARHVRSGSLREEALLYDSVTREWAPARTHPAFARLEAPDGEGRGEPPTSADAPGPEEPRDDRDPAPVADEPLPALEPLPEDALQVDTLELFLREQELERWEDQGEPDPVDRSSFLSDGALTEADRHAPISGSWGDTPPEPGDPGFESFLNAQRRWGRSQARRDGSAHGGGRGAPESSLAPAAPVRKSSALTRWFRRTRARSQQRSRRAGGRQLALLIPLLAVGGWGVAEAWGHSPLERVLPAPPVDSLALLDVPLPPDVEAAETEAFEDMVLGLERLRTTMRVDEPPPTWMSGPYLAGAMGFPEVREFWVRYQDYVDMLRDREEELFREGFVTRLRMQGVSGPALSIRIARAMRDFEADAPRRDSTYDGMEFLAVAALGLHDFLVVNTDRIRYAPVDVGVNDDPILEAVPLDEATEEALWTRIERLVQALDGVADSDPLSRRDVSRSVLGSLALPDSTAGF